MDFQQSKTFVNLQSAYEYQLRAGTEYVLFSNKARTETLIEIANTFSSISGNETAIARRLRNLILDGEPDTSQNLIIARDEEFNSNNKYREYATTAKEEGYAEISSLFSGIANIKLNHNLVFQTFSNNIQNNELFCKKETSLWICEACGNIMSGTCAPTLCPICLYPQGYYQILRIHY